MMQQLCERNERRSGQSKQHYFSYAIVWFCMAIALGSIFALLEYLAWIPRGITQLFPLSNTIISDFSLVRLSGVLISSSVIVPVLFWAGLHPVGYHYTSRILLFSFWFFIGVDVWQCLFLLYQNEKINVLAVILLVAWTLCVGYLVLRVHAVATVGIQRTGESAAEIRPSRYWSKLPECWGALMILRMLFYALYAWIC